MRSREEHLAWCKSRALEYVDRGDTTEALGSMFSDLRKHPDLADHSAIELGFLMMLGGQLSDPDAARKFIEGFN